MTDTINNLNRTEFIFHSDHGAQYSSKSVLATLKKVRAKTSMGRVGNSLDNREIEYFFCCLKGEYLNHINTKQMNIKDITKHISWYINWYNNERIQKNLNWKTPAPAAGVNVQV
ncbi:transposase [Spiroplasma chinense]|uniref:Transposase n=1 Tax=Spiroplasma chinense TaxID=216932 RepID=A0A5B9Y3K9_9MOLU|nr:integrase core domain-containing protein [Spiroplasma chinense]QEH61375.1 transposase [Spiroplasma chinense]